MQLTQLLGNFRVGISGYCNPGIFCENDQRFTGNGPLISEKSFAKCPC